MTVFCVHSVIDQPQTGASVVFRQGMDRPSRTYKITPCWVTLLPPGRRAAVLVQPSSLRLHWLGAHVILYLRCKLQLCENTQVAWKVTISAHNDATVDAMVKEPHPMQLGGGGGGGLVEEKKKQIIVL
jgi:hypothetical protein